MSLWARVQYLSQASKQLIFDRYKENGIPIEVRQNLPVWIENNFLSEESNQWIPGNEEHESKIRQLCVEFFDEIERTVGSDNDFLQISLKNAAYNLQQFTPIDMMTRIKACLDEELRLLSQERNADFQIKGEPGVTSGNAEVTAMSQRVCDLVNHRIRYGSMIEMLQSTQTELQLKTHQLQSIQTIQEQMSLGGFQRNGINYEASIQQKVTKQSRDVQNSVATLRQQELCCLELSQEIVKELEFLVSKLTTDFLQRFKWSEWALDNSISLDDVQRWYGDIIESISVVRNLLQQGLRDSVALGMQYELNQSNQQTVQYLLNVLQNLYLELMSNCMIVEEQPPQVIKKETKFNASVRFLCGERYIPQHCQPMVTTVVINEAQANLLYNTKDSNKVTNAPCGKIISNMGNKFSDSNSSKLIHQFRNVAISQVRKPDKKTDSRAMSEKFCLIFFTQVQIGDKSQTQTVWCCSVPFVFIVHVSQKLEGWATIFWDNSFREPNRIPFAVPEEVPWSKMSVALNRCFKTMTNTKWDLTEINLRYLGEKCFQNNPDFSDKFFISRRKFCEKECTTTISLWEWFYACIELTNRHLKPFWDQGYIIGFINRCKAEDILVRIASPGTFLLRFSDNTLGGISITYVESLKDGQSESKQVQSLLPFTDQDLKMRSLEDRLKDIVLYHSVYHQNKENADCLTSKAIAFASRNDAGNRKGNTKSVRLNYVPANIIMVINPNGTSMPSRLTSPSPEFNLPFSPAETDITDDGILDDILDMQELINSCNWDDDVDMNTPL